MQRLLADDVADLDLAPPEILDWSRVAGFRYHYEFRQSFTRADIQLSTYLELLSSPVDSGDR